MAQTRKSMSASEKAIDSTKKTAKKAQKKVADNKTAAVVGLTVATVGALGAYFFYGAGSAKHNREKAKAWMTKAKGEVMEHLEKAKSISKEEYEEIVDTVVSSYVTVKSASKKEALDVANELKDSWKKIEKVAKKEVKKPVNKTAKKVATKTKVKKS